MSTTRPLVVALIGPPNAGKTSLYNFLTGSRFKTVNYPGATVEFSVGRVRAANDSRTPVRPAPDCHGTAAALPTAEGGIHIVDTPGIVSLVPRSQDEQVAVDAIVHLKRLGQVQDTPDLILNVIDATQPERHLPLFRQIQQTGLPVVVALTMNDIATRRQRPMDANALSQQLGVPVIDFDGRTGHGLTEIVSTLEATPLLPDGHTVVLPTQTQESEIRDNFRWADAVVRQCTTGTSSDSFSVSRLDRLTLHPVLGLLVFATVMSGLFWSVFSAAGPFMDWTESFFSWLGNVASQNLPDTWYTSLLVDGIIAGAGSVSVFIPQIAILFLALGLLEDSGYLARGAMLVDRFLSVIGLNGKSFVPLLSGNACAIPAIMAARTIPGKRERVLTLLVIPLMSCSARLPVWGLLLAFLIPADKPWLGGIALTSIYILSLVFASLVALVGGKLLRLPVSHSGFQVELPMWRPPTFRTVVVSAWDRTVSYVQRAGLTILAVSVGFWILMTFPTPEYSFATMAGKLLSPLLAPMGLDWRVGIALIAAFAAREVFVSTLAVVYAVQGAEDSTLGLVEAMRQATFDGTTQLVFTPATIVGLVVFFLIALQCMTTVAVMRKETSNRFALGQLAAFVALAWVMATLTVQGLRLLGVS